MANFTEAVNITLEHEGGYVNDSTDAGGETKYGISKRSYPHIDIENLTIQEASIIYKTDYWDKVRGDSIDNQLIAQSIFDCAVNMGPSRASKLAQECASVAIDGMIGPQSIQAINATNAELFDCKFRLAKIRFYADLCNRKPEQKKFLLGWINRTLA